MVYVFLADGFEEMEALTPVDILRRAEIDVQTVGIGSKTVRGSHGIWVECDLYENEPNPLNLQMIVLPGGMPGALNLEKSLVVKAFIDHCAENNIAIAAICAAPAILGHMGLLNDKRFTCYSGFEGEAPLGKFTGGVCEKDGNIITSRGAGTALDFALLLLETLKGSQRAQLMKAALQCR
ncbi:MAG: DJ-1/PfpI family protein [Hydrogenoanaerobacterium sp.]